jgi:hypothetical protein
VSEENSEADFDRWCFTATDDRYLIHGRPIPMLTTLLHRVCNGDAEKFEEALHIMRFAFDAGKLALNPETGTQNDFSAKSEEA